MKCVLACLLLLTFHAADAAVKPNFVWIIADDMSPDTCAYSSKEVDGRLVTKAKTH